MAGKSKECTHPNCSHTGQHYYASGVLLIRLPYSTYGLDVLAFIGGQHEYELKQLVEIQGQLNKLGIQINERNVGKLYRQFLALLGGLQTQVRHRLAQAAEAHGGLIWAIDGLQPEAGGPLLYVLYEVLSGTVVSAIQLKQHSYEQMNEWLKPYKDLPFKVKATLSDGEDVIVKALKQTWASAPHQRCQAHVLSSLSEPALSFDSQLRQQLKSQLKQLPVVPLESKRPHPVDPLFPSYTLCHEMRN